MAEIKSRDLSIGYWVEIDREPAKVLCLRIVGGHIFKGVSGQMYRCCGGNDFKPIPLTPEILEKNGFEENCGRWYNSEARMEFEQYKDGWCRTINCGEYSVYFIKYVHQLQHAMRLVGVEKDIEV